jgi:hypothetical protein
MANGNFPMKRNNSAIICLFYYWLKWITHSVCSIDFYHHASNWQDLASYVPICTAWAWWTLWAHFPLSQHKVQSFVSDITYSIDLLFPANGWTFCHAHAHIINAQHNYLIAPFSNASKQFRLVILPLNIICCFIVLIRAEESFSPLTEFIVPVPPPPLLRSKKKIN